MSSVWEQIENSCRATTSEFIPVPREKLEWMANDHQRVLDLLKEANALLDQVYQHVDSHDLAQLGQCRVKALIDSHKADSAALNSWREWENL